MLIILQIVIIMQAIFLYVEILNSLNFRRSAVSHYAISPLHPVADVIHRGQNWTL